MPEGPGRQGLPDHRLCAAGRCSRTTKDKDLAWKLIATLAGPKGNVDWNKKIGALPIYKSAEKDPFYADPKFKGWFDELADPNVVPTVMPTYLRGVRLLRRFDRGQDDASRRCSAQITPEDMAKQWADYLTTAQQKFLAKSK